MSEAMRPRARTRRAPLCVPARLGVWEWTDHAAASTQINGNKAIAIGSIGTAGHRGHLDTYVMV